MKKLLLISTIIFGAVSIAAAQAAEVDPAAVKAAKSTTPVKPVVNAKVKAVTNADVVAKQKVVALDASTSSIGARSAGVKPAATPVDKQKLAAMQKRTAATAPAAPAAPAAKKSTKTTHL
jgi:hypothetical protein